MLDLAIFEKLPYLFIHPVSAHKKTATALTVAVQKSLAVYLFIVAKNSSLLLVPLICCSRKCIASSVCISLM